MKGFIFDLKNDGANKVKITLKNGGETSAYDVFDAYFYLEDTSIAEEIKSMPGIKSVEKTELLDDGKKREFLKITVTDPSTVIKLRNDLADYGPREADVPYAFRYLIDKDLYPMKHYDFCVKDGKIMKAEEEKQETINLKIAAFDIETYNKDGIPDPERDPIIIMSYANSSGCESFYWTKNKSSEKEMLLNFLNRLKKDDPDVLIGYNSSGFDIPYIKKRCAKHGIDFDLSKDGSGVSIKKGAFSTRADMYGRFHMDAYDGVSFLTAIGAINIPKIDLESAYKELLGKTKLDVDTVMMWKMWENGGKDLETLIQYNKEDSTAAYEIGKEILPLYIELSRIVGLPIYEISRMSTSQMVEWLLARDAHKKGIIIPPHPSEDEAQARMANPIKGAFVKLPKSGLHERIVVCDFRSLYPSLIIAYNIDKTTLTRDKDSFESPEGHRFSKKHEGLIPHMLKELVEYRASVKKEMKKHKRDSVEYKILYARQWALKIVANSAYGYMGYGRAKWYSREAAESVTAWARQYIHETIKKAEDSGFEVLYADTDSVFLKLNEKTLDDARTFVETVNKSLPKGMELELEGYYPRGIFVTKREGGAAKKKYALMREDKTLEIKGFELVRRDWANVAKTAQESVIKAVLEEGNPKKAIEIVKKIVDDLRNYRVKTDDVVIYTQIKRKIGNYEQQAPHVKAAKKLIKAGKKVKVGTVLEYVVTSGSGSISDRSTPVELLGNKRYDPDYYVENQVLPAVMKILNELGVKENDLKFKGTQEGLNKWF
ncbi:MAG: DNA-directed DNA polymerase [archaeon]